MGILDRLGITRKAFTGLVTAGIIAIVIGAVLEVIAYVIINAIVNGVVTGATLGAANGTINSSFWATMTNILQALSFAGIGLMMVGIGLILYVILGFAAPAAGRR